MKGKRIKIPKRKFLIFIFLFPFLNLYSQQINLTGTVQSSMDNLVLSGATISLEGSSVSTVSDEGGRFSFYSPIESGIIVVRYVGYNPLRFEFDKDSEFPLNIKLDPIENVLDNVQVIGYGETTKRFNTGSVVEISANEIASQPVTNVMSALSGKMPGVYVQTKNGLPGGGIDIKIRGTGSILAGTTPLYIIDGVPYDGDGMRENLVVAVNNIAGATNPLNILNPSDIESITVLKDADATAIYGSRGSNGVVLIKTKTGDAGGVSMNLSLEQGISRVASLPQLLGLEQYLSMRHEAFENDNRVPSSDPLSPEYAPDLTIWNQNEETNWGDYIFGNTSNLSNAQVSIYGGRESTKFSLSGNFRSEGTFMVGDNKYNRGGFKASFQHNTPDEKFKINFTSIYNLDRNDLSNPSNSSSNIFLLPPNYPIYDENGDYNWYAGNNVVAQQNARSISNTNNFVGNLLAQYTAPFGIEFKLSAGYNRRSGGHRRVFPEVSLHPSIINYTIFREDDLNSFILEPQAEFHRKINDSKFQILLGGTLQSRTIDELTIKASNFSNEYLMEDLGSAGIIDSRSNSMLEYKYISVFGRLTYNFQDKYIINLTGRRDGSSRFGPANRFGNFYSIAGAWLFSEENGFKDNMDVFSFGKLRASYGLTGNDQITDYEYLSTYENRTSSLYEGNSILQPSRIFNEKFQWELTKKFEAATELGFFHNRLFMTINYYLNRSGNQLIRYTLPRATGFSSYQANLPAIVQNSGFEFELESQIIERNNFRWSATANLTLPKNKLVEFENIENSSYANTLQVGSDITRVSGFQLAEIDYETGVAKFTDKDGNLENPPFQFHTLGRETPDYYGGFGNSFSFKNFDFNVFIQFAKQSTFGNFDSNQFGSQAVNSYESILDRWSPQNKDSNIPKVSSLNRADLFYFGLSGGNYFEIPYLRLKNVSLTYSFPEKVSKNIGFRAARVSLLAQNLFTIWNKTLPVLDPEVGGFGLTPAIPPAKSFVFGVNLTL